MNPEQVQHFRQRLLALRQKEQERADYIAEGLRTPLSESIEELSLYDNHPGDIGDATYEREKDLGFKLYFEDRLAMIAEALEAVQNGTYGVCEACSREISMERLEAVPYTTLCLDCKRAGEGLERHPRPIEEDVVQLPFGGNYGGHDEIPFDGEDAWQAVARYGTSNSPCDIGSVSDYDDTYLNSREDIGLVEEYEGIAAHKKADGQFYKNFGGEEDDEDSPFNYANE